MEYVKNTFFFSLILSGLFYTTEVYGKGLEVSPSSYTWENVTIGAKVKCPINILITNKSEYVASYTLRTVNPSELNVNLSDGFEELPSKEWISFSVKRLAIGPGESKQVEIFINIPKQKKHFNKEMSFFIEVKEYTSGNTVFTIACYPQYFMITENYSLLKYFFGNNK